MKNLMILVLMFSVSCLADDVGDDSVVIELKPLNNEGELHIKPLRKDSISIQTLLEQLKTDRIVGGAIESPVNSHPWQVLVSFNDETICGGTILNANFVLTAAHCIPASITSSLVVAGASTWCIQETDGLYWNNEASQQSRSVKKINRTSGRIAYKKKTNYFDVALLELDSPLTLNAKVAAANLPTGVTPTGTSLTVSGWGTTSEDGDISCSLREVAVPKVSLDLCNKYYDNSIRSSQLCAGFAAGGKDSCQGDSGGPLVSKSSTGVATIVGVVSFGSGCARPNYYGVYTDVYQYLPWIKSIIAQTTPAKCTSTNVNIIGDGYCNPATNTAGCLWDGGDCCTSSRTDWNKLCGTNCTCNQK